MAELALAALAAGTTVYSSVKQNKQAKAMKSELTKERRRVEDIEAGQKRVRAGGRGMLAFVDGDLGEAMGGAGDDRQEHLLGAGGR